MINPAVRAVAKLAGSPLIVVRAKLAGRTAIERMADDLRVASANSACITAEHLELMGWTEAQIAAHGRAARLRAIELAAG